MKRYFAVCLLATLPLCGCAEIASLLGPASAGPDPVLVAQKEVETNQNAVALLQTGLQAAEATQAPTLPQIRADLQVATTSLESAKAKLVKAKVDKGFGYAEVGVKLVGSLLQPFFLMSGPAATGIVALLGVIRQAFGGSVKEAK